MRDGLGVILLLQTDIAHGPVQFRVPGKLLEGTFQHIGGLIGLIPFRIPAGEIDGRLGKIVAQFKRALVLLHGAVVVAFDAQRRAVARVGDGVSIIMFQRIAPKCFRGLPQGRVPVGQHSEHHHNCRRKRGDSDARRAASPVPHVKSAPRDQDRGADQ